MNVPNVDNLVFRHLPTNGINLHVADAGPSDGPLVFLLHGFPEFWFGWRHQIGSLASAGLRVVAVDQRGYNLSDKPAGTAAYDLDVLSDDILGLADTLGRRTFTIVGHDWGSIIAWWIAARNPDRLERFVVLNAAHPSVWKEAIGHNPAQRRKSWYVGMLQIPWLPEWMMRARRYKALADALKSAARPDALLDIDLEHYRAAWAQPGALTAMVNWYRAIARKLLPAVSSVHIDVPALILWGVNDRYAVRELAEQTRKLCTQARLVYFEQATHWVQHDEPEQVNAQLLAFLK